MSDCTSCTKLSPLLKDSSSCGGSKQKISDIRIACCSLLTESFTATTDPACANGYISDLVPTDPLGNPTPLVVVDIINEEELDETLEYSFDRTTDIGTITYTLIPTIRIYNPNQQCTFESMLGQDFCLYYKITNKSGDYIHVRFTGKLTAVSGGRNAGYQLTFDNLDPDIIDRPKFVNAGSPTVTQALLDSLTQFS